MFILEVQGFMLIVARVTSFILAVPGLSHKSLPNTAKVALSLIISFMVYVSIPKIAVFPETLLFILGIMREVLIGLAMGFSAKLIFSAVEMAGSFIDFQVGYSMGAVYDPMSGVTSSYYGKLFYWMSIMVFFMLDFHHALIRSLMDSFSVAVPGAVGFGGLNLQGILYLFSYSFKIAFSIAAPMVIVLLVIDIVMGLISRSVPQINVFMLGMPLKSLLGMVMFLLLAGSFLSHAGKTLGMMTGFIEKAVEMFR